MASNDEQYAREASESSLVRKNLHAAKAELVGHMAKSLEEVEKLRGLSYIIAKRHGLPPDHLWGWVVKELCSE